MPLYREISPRAFRAELAYAQLLSFESRAENDSGLDVAAAHCSRANGSSGNARISTP